MREVRVHAVPKKLLGKVVLAEWLDSHHQSGWARGEPPTEPVTCMSAGLLTSANGRVVTIAGHWTQEEDCQRNGEMTIPTSALVSLRALE